jgi:hypothetical protein
VSSCIRASGDDGACKAIPRRDDRDEDGAAERERDAPRRVGVVAVVVVDAVVAVAVAMVKVA